MRKYGFSLPPVILGVVLGNRFEEALRQSMIMTQGNLLALLERPIVLTFVALTVISLAGPFLLRRLRFRGQAVRLDQEQS
jgi:putative tricarboxylic transport membrane protein